MKLKMLPVLLLGIAVSANVYCRPQDEGERAEIGPRFGAGQTRTHESQPSVPQSAPQQVPQSAPRQVPQQPQQAPRQMPQAPQASRNDGQSRNQTPTWQVDRNRGNNSDRNGERGYDRDNDRNVYRYRNGNNNGGWAGNGNWNNNQRNDNSHQWFDNRQSGQRGRDNYERNRYDGYRANNYRYSSGRYYARQRFSIGIYFLPRGYSTRVWYVGDWLPYDYYDDVRFHLDSPWSYNLYDAPVGCHWVRVGADALLIDYYSGEILEVVYSLFW
jgi:Nickel/cobalt transporter regulator